MLNFLISLSESDKRVLISLLLILILVFILIGYLVKLFKYIIKVQCDFVDKSMYDILDANLVTDKNKFFKISFEKNRRKFYFDSRIPMIVIIIVFLVIFGYQIVISNFSWAFIASNLSDAHFELSWPTTKLFGIPVISDWPTISKASEFHFDRFDAWLTYILFIAFVYGFIHFLICSTALLVRNIHTIKIGNEYFRKDLKELKDAKKNLGQDVHTKKPTQEMKDFVEEQGTK